MGPLGNWAKFKIFRERYIRSGVATLRTHWKQLKKICTKSSSVCKARKVTLRKKVIGGGALVLGTMAFGAYTTYDWGDVAVSIGATLVNYGAKQEQKPLTNDEIKLMGLLGKAKNNGRDLCTYEGLVDKTERKNACKNFVGTMAGIKETFEIMKKDKESFIEVLNNEDLNALEHMPMLEIIVNGQVKQSNRI